MIPKVFFYFVQNNEVGCKIKLSLNDLETDLLNHDTWPALLHVGFEAPLVSSLKESLLNAPKALFCSIGVVCSGLTSSWTFNKDKILEFKEFASYPCDMAFGQNLIEFTDDLNLLSDQMKGGDPNANFFQDYALRQWDWSVRTKNVFNNANIQLLSELVTYYENELLLIPNFGRKSLREVKKFLDELGLSLNMKLDEYEIKKAFDDNGKMIFHSPISNILENSEKKNISPDIYYSEERPKFIFDFLSSIEKIDNERRIDILKRRSGLLERDEETLEEISKTYSVSRERIRQIESQALDKMRGFGIGWNFESYWDKKISSILDERIYPLSIEHLCDHDDFSDIRNGKVGTLKYVLSCLNTPLYVLDELEDEFITRLHQKEFEKIIIDLKSFLEICNKKTIDYIYQETKKIFPQTAKELARKSTDYCLRNSAIGTNENNEQFLINYSASRSVSNVTIEIFDQTDKIISNKEIREIAQVKYPSVDFRTVQNRIQTLKGIYPMSHGTWGKIKHLNLDNKELAIVKDEIQFFIDKLTVDQFHSREIKETIFLKKVISNEIFDDFVISAIIREYFEVPYLGRQMFANPESEQGKRVLISDVLQQILVSNGKPMHGKELFTKANKIRSMNNALPIFIKEPIILLGKNYYGLDYWDEETNNLR